MFSHSLTFAPTASTPTADLTSITPDALPASPLTQEDEFNVVIGMTLADAIREGAEFMPQAMGWGDGVHSGCALTVAALALEKKGYK